MDVTSGSFINGIENIGLSLLSHPLFNGINTELIFT